MATNHHYTGLTDVQVLESRAKYGSNVLASIETSVWQKIIECMHFLPLKVELAIFVIAALEVIVLGSYVGLIVIAAVVLSVTPVAYILEAQIEKTFKSLIEVNDDTLVKVIRNNNVCQVPRKDIVVGDIVLLDAGEEVPADAELLECMNLTLNESSLTGEPQCTKTTNPEEFDKDATYPSNHIMKGCNVMEGDCVAKVFAVGDATACGKILHEE